MDPNANLMEQEIILTVYASGSIIVARSKYRLTELREALARWLDRGGFPPDWTRCPKAAKYYGH
jgi:hypothetical protein